MTALMLVGLPLGNDSRQCEIFSHLTKYLQTQTKIILKTFIYIYKKTKYLESIKWINIKITDSTNLSMYSMEGNSSLLWIFSGRPKVWLNSNLDSSKVKTGGSSVNQCWKKNTHQKLVYKKAKAKCLICPYIINESEKMTLKPLTNLIQIFTLHFLWV